MPIPGPFIVCECDDLNNPFFSWDNFRSLGEWVKILRAAEAHIRQCEKCCRKYGDPMLLREMMLKKCGTEETK